MRFDTSRTEQEVFDDLERLCASPGYIHVLAELSMRDNLVVLQTGELTEEALAAARGPERTVRTEFSTLLGLLLKHSIDFAEPSPDDLRRLIDRTGELLEELHACLNQPMMAALKRAVMEVHSGASREAANPFLQAEVLREPIFYGADSAYSFQYTAFAVERYASDDEWLLAHKGFRIADGRAVCEALIDLHSEKLANIFDEIGSRSATPPSVLSGFTFSLTEIAAAASLSPEVTSAVLAVFTAPDAPTNAAFRSIGDFNLANACPILRTPTGDYVSLETYGVLEALYDSPFYWMATDKAHRDAAAKHRGDFTEAFVNERLAAVFGGDKVHRGVEIMRGGQRIGEIDVLVLFADRAVVVQCKSKKLTLAARKGNDLQLRDDFKKAVQDAYDQAYLCSKYLTDPSCSLVGADDSTLGIPELQDIYPLCVVSDHYPALAAQARQFLRFESDDLIQPPFVGDVFLIDVLAELLPSPLRWLSYINRRVGYADRINAVNELAILGYHLSSNLWLEDSTSLVTIAEEFSTPVDTAMTVRRTGVPGEWTPEGVLTRLNGSPLGHLLEYIEDQPHPALIDLGFLLLSLNSSTIDSLNQGLERLTAQTRRDRADHDLTLAFDDSHSGLTIHCSCRSNDDAAKLLAEHCARRKYFHRAKGWLGVAVRPDNGLPRLAIHLQGVWEYDPVLERKMADMARPSPPSRTPFHGAPSGRARPTGAGRNQPCPCGSGAKFKKCCGR